MSRELVMNLKKFHHGSRVSQVTPRELVVEMVQYITFLLIDSVKRRAYQTVLSRLWTSGLIISSPHKRSSFFVLLDQSRHVKYSLVK